MSETLRKTALHAWHEAHGAKLVDFAGWSMPIQYTSIVEEHTATRTACALFDVSHMGRFIFRGPAAQTFLDGLLTRRVTALAPGDVRYAMVTNDEGKVLDDVLVTRYQQPDCYGLVVNASNRDKLLRWLEPRVGKYDVQFRDETTETAMIAVQGPLAIATADSLLQDVAPSSMKYYTVSDGSWNGTPISVSRTGYTGEDGLELTVPGEIATEVWQAFMTAIEPECGKPAGLGARDTLRLEAGMPLYGHELSEDLTPFDVGLGFAVQLKDRSFPGSDALQAAKPAPTLTRIGLQLEGKRVPREHYAVYQDDTQIGEISSGTFSPTLKYPIAMALVKANSASVGDTLYVDLRGKRLPATVVKLPFYTRS